MGGTRHDRISEEQDKNVAPSNAKPRRTIMGSYRSRVGNGMSGNNDIWHTLVMMRNTKMGGEDE